VNKLRLFLLAWLAAVTCSALVSAAPAPVNITLWHQFNYAERLVLDEQLKRFHQLHPDIRVTSLYRETEELRSGFQNSALAGRGPEMIHGPSDQVGPFATMGIIYPMESLFPSAELDSLDPRALVWYEDHLYQLADRFGNHLALVYNKSYLPEPPTTDLELIEMGMQQTIDLDGDGKLDRFGLVWNFTEPFYFVPFLHGFGGGMINDANEPTLDSQANRAALRFVQDLRDKHRITPQNTDYETAHTLFREGKAAMIINGDWSWATYQESGIDIGVARIPMISETGLWPAPLVSPRGYSLNRNIEGDRLDATLTFLRFMLAYDQQRELAARTGIMPARETLKDDPVITGNPVMAGSLAQIEVGVPMPVVPELRAIWDSMRPFYQAVLGGTIQSDQAARQMQEMAVRKIREMNTVTPPAPYVPFLYAIALLGIAALLWFNRHAFREFFRDSRKRPFVYWMVVPAFLVIVLTVVYPFIYNVVLSLSNMGLRNFFDWEVVGFQNYGKVFLEPGFYSILGKTVIWTTVNLLFHVGIGVFLALLLHRVLPGRGIIRMILILPWAVPQYITALTWRGMFNTEYGAINLIIAKYFGMPIVNWLGSPFEAFAACILTNIWLGFPFMMIVALGGLQSIPHQLYEAADIDGASAWQKFRNITYPLLKPVMTPAIILGTVWTFNNLNVVWLVSNAGEPSDKTHILVSFVYKSAFNLYRYGYAAAMSMVIFAILLVFGIFFLKKARAVEPVY